jgi:hypothetical protein
MGSEAGCWKVAALAQANSGSEVAMSGRGICALGAMGSRDGRDEGVWLGSSGESGVVMGRPSASWDTWNCGGGTGGR